MAQQRRFAQRSSRGRQVIINRSGHGIALEALGGGDRRGP
jgi:hypothetical protein